MTRCHLILSLALATGASLEARGQDERVLGVFVIDTRVRVNSEFLAVVDGQVRVLRTQPDEPKDTGIGRAKKYLYRETSSAWQITRTPKGYTIRIHNSKRFKDWYLSYDSETPGQGLLLLEKPTAGAYWNIDHVPALSPNSATPIRARIADKEWSLDFDPHGEAYLRDTAVPFVTVYMPRLTEGLGARWVIDYFGG